MLNFILPSIKLEVEKLTSSSRSRQELQDILFNFMSKQCDIYRVMIASRLCQLIQSLGSKSGVVIISDRPGTYHRFQQRCSRAQAQLPDGSFPENETGEEYEYGWNQAEINFSFNDDKLYHGFEAVGRKLCKYPTYDVLTLDGFNISDLQARQLFAGLRSQRKIKSLYMEGIKTSDVFCKEMGEFLKTDPWVQHLKIGSFRACGISTAPLSIALKTHSSLRTILIDCNGITQLDTLTWALAYQPQLEKLVLYYINFSTQRILSGLALTVAESHSLRELEINYWSFDEGVRIDPWLSSLEQTRSLEKLTITSTNPETFFRILSVVANSTISRLALRGFDLLSSMIWEKLTQLVVDGCLDSLGLLDTIVSQEGLSCLVQGLSKTRSLRTLNLKNVKGMMGESIMAEAIKILSHNKSIQSLDLESTQFDEDGVLSLLECLKHNKTLKRLNLTYCNLRENHIQLLAKVLATENNTLISLCMGEFWSIKGVALKVQEICSTRVPQLKISYYEEY